MQQIEELTKKEDQVNECMQQIDLKALEVEKWALDIRRKEYQKYAPFLYHHLSKSLLNIQI